MRIAVFGLGYVGSVSAACLAEAGHDVIGVDIDTDKVAAINAGKSPIIEPGLEAMIGRGMDAGRLMATPFSDEAVPDTDIALVCVGTPGHANGRLDVGALKRVCSDIGSALQGSGRPYTVVIRSTVLPGTTGRSLIPALRHATGNGTGSHVSVAVNPEFMREGTAIRDFRQPPLTLVGAADASTAGLLRRMYEGVDAPFVATEVRTAEMVKYVANTWHALKVCFANEVGSLSGALGVDAQEVMRIFRMDRKLNISEAYLRPGFAFGGSCLPKDVRALLYAARDTDLALPVLDGIMPSNEFQIRRGIEQVLATGKRRIGVAGLAFKPDTDDLRESPMVALVEALIGKGCDVRILDHNVSVSALTGANRRYIEEEIPHVGSLMCDSERSLLQHAEVLVVPNSSEQAMRLIAAASPACAVVDLTQGALGRIRPTTEEGDEEWTRAPVLRAASAAASQSAP